MLVFAREFAAGLPVTFWWLSAGGLVMALATFVFPFLALFLTARGFSVEQTGLLVALFGGGTMLSGPVAGALADRIGRRPTLLASLIGTAALTALLGALSSTGAIAAATLALGLVANAFRPAANAAIADLVPARERARAYGLLYWGNNARLALSFVIGGALAGQGYSRLFFLDAGTTLLFAALVWWRVPETRPSAPPTGTAPLGRGYAAALADGPFLAILGLNVAFLLLFCQHQVALPLEMAQRGLSPADFGRVMSVNGLLIVALQPLAGRFTRRFDPAHVLTAASLLVGLGYGAYTFCVAPLHYAAATAAWSLGEILAFPIASALVAEISPPDLRGRYQGLFGLSLGVGTAVAPALGGAVMARLGAWALWAGCLGVGVLVAIGHLLAGRMRRGRVGRACAARPQSKKARGFG